MADKPGPVGEKRRAAIGRDGSTPFVWKSPQRTEVVTVGPGVAVSYDTAGKELWRLSGMSSIPIPSPFAYEGLLYVNGGRGKPLYAIKPGATGDLTTGRMESLASLLPGRTRAAAPTCPTEVAYDGALYSLSETGILSRFDAKTGKLHYRSRLEGGEAFT